MVYNIVYRYVNVHGLNAFSSRMSTNEYINRSVWYHALLCTRWYSFNFDAYANIAIIYDIRTDLIVNNSTHTRLKVSSKVSSATSIWTNEDKSYSSMILHIASSWSINTLRQNCNICSRRPCKGRWWFDSPILSKKRAITLIIVNMFL